MTSLPHPAIRARLEAATPGPWVSIEPGHKTTVRAGGPAGRRIAETFAAQPSARTRDGYLKSIAQNEANADLIAHAPTDLAYLLAEIERKDAALRICQIVLLAAQCTEAEAAARAALEDARKELEGAP